MRNMRNVIAGLRRWQRHMRPRRSTYVPQRNAVLVRGLR